MSGLESGVVVKGDDGLPQYKWPVDIGDDDTNYNVIQAREDGSWKPKWIIVDRDGTIISMIELDHWPEPTELATAIFDRIREMHGLSKEVTGKAGVVHQVVRGIQTPPGKSFNPDSD